MDQFVIQLMEELSVSPTELTEKNKKKIQKYLPVPTDFEILWADINSFGGFPSGVVLTDRGIVLKGPRPSMKEKQREKNEQVYNIPYQIILWEYFEPSEYNFQREELGDCYVIKRENTVLSVFHDKSLFDFLKKYEEIDTKSNLLLEGAILAEIENFNFDAVAFNAAYGKDQSNTGHGVYAEEAGAILDKLNGEKATVVGRNNAKNGPDKLVDGKPVQCKFCKSPGSSVGACFKKNPDTGNMEYRYFDIKSGNPMQVEVPADQYEKALAVMRKRIADGQVKGVTDPDMAEVLVRKSKLTYAQARNLAKAGTFESLTYDAVTGTINCTFAAGISALVSFGLAFWKTNDPQKARDAAIDTAISVFGPSLAANILSNQIAKTSISKALIPVSDKIVQMLGTKTVQKLINARRVLLGKGKIYGNAANKSLAKALRSNAIVEGIAFLAFSVPDTYRVCFRKTSGAQYTKNMISTTASFMGGLVGTYGAGMAVGAVGEKIGKKIDKRLGSVIGFVAGAGGSMLAGFVVNKLTSLFKEDDCVITARIFNAVLINMSIEYLFEEAEMDKLIEILNTKEKDIRKLQVALRRSSHQYYDVQKFMEPLFDEVLKKRSAITTELEEKSFEIDKSMCLQFA
ncbi:MAG: hypothetical protein HDR11_17545 [Lachnospiraceae bacterium]|nr:hypothetical protein [Lachnospiraceae bacterium]